MSAFLAIAAAALLLQASPSAAPSTAPAAAKSQQVKVSDDDKVSCQDTTPTGSFISQRECHTQREWRAMTEDSQDTFRTQASSARGSMPH